MQDETIRTTCYPMAPDLRRCAIYAMVGLHLIAIVNFWVGNFVQNRGVTNIVWGCGVIIAISLSMFIPLNWRIRVSSKGISRRAFFRWDHWSWEDIASGKLVKKYPRKMTDTTRNFWRRSFNLGHLQQEDYQTVMELINRYYKIPLTTEFPDELKLKYGFRRTVILNRNGIQVIDKGEIQVYGWDDVQRVRVVRKEPKTRNFSSLELSLSNREIELNTFGGTPRWKGATVEEVNDFFLAYTAEEHVVIDIAYDTPKQTQDIEKQLEKARKMLREGNYLMVMILLVIVAMFLGCIFKESMHLSEQEEAVPCIFLILMTVMGIGFWFTQKEKKKRITKLEQLLIERKHSENR